MKNFVQSGNSITLAAAPYAVDSGEGVATGALFGIAAGDALINAEVDVAVQGVFDIAKNAASVFIVGQKVYFKVSDKKCHSDADEDSNSGGAAQAIGYATEAAGAGATTVRVRLVPVV